MYTRDSYDFFSMWQWYFQWEAESAPRSKTNVISFVHFSSSGPDHTPGYATIKNQNFSNVLGVKKDQLQMVQNGIDDMCLKSPHIGGWWYPLAIPAFFLGIGLTIYNIITSKSQFNEANIKNIIMAAVAFPIGWLVFVNLLQLLRYLVRGCMVRQILGKLVKIHFPSNPRYTISWSSSLLGSYFVLTFIPSQEIVETVAQSAYIKFNEERYLKYQDTNYDPSWDWIRGGSNA